jgi:hypothetical protein
MHHSNFPVKLWVRNIRPLDPDQARVDRGGRERHTNRELRSLLSAVVDAVFLWSSRTRTWIGLFDTAR